MIRLQIELPFTVKWEMKSTHYDFFFPSLLFDYLLISHFFYHLEYGKKVQLANKGKRHVHWHSGQNEKSSFLFFDKIQMQISSWNSKGAWGVKWLTNLRQNGWILWAETNLIGIKLSKFDQNSVILWQINRLTHNRINFIELYIDCVMQPIRFSFLMHPLSNLFTQLIYISRIEK